MQSGSASGNESQGVQNEKVLFAASECVPFIKTGGLADVCGALPKQFDKEEWDVRVVIPNYSCIPEKYRNQFEYVTHFYMGTGSYNPGATWVS